MSERSPQPASLQRWRIEVLDTVTRVSFYIALPLLVLNQILAITDGNVTAFGMGVFGIAFMAVITFVRSISPSIRSIVFIASRKISRAGNTTDGASSPISVHDAAVS